MFCTDKRTLFTENRFFGSILMPGKLQHCSQITQNFHEFRFLKKGLLIQLKIRSR